MVTATFAHYLKTVIQPAICGLTLLSALTYGAPASAEIPGYVLSSFHPAAIENLYLNSMNDREEVVAYNPMITGSQGVKFSPMHAPQRSRAYFPSQINAYGQMVGSYGGAFWGIFGTSLEPGGMTLVRDILGISDHVTTDAINDSGIIAGTDYFGQICNPGAAYLFTMWTDRIECIDPPAGFGVLTVREINASGDIVGAAVRNNGTTERSQAYVRRAGKPVNLISTHPNLNSYARGLSARGEFVVVTYDSNFIGHGSLLVRSVAPQLSEAFPMFPGRYGPAIFDALGVNSLGLVVGISRHGEAAIFDPIARKYKKLAELLTPTDGFANIELIGSLTYAPSGKIAAVISFDDGTGVAVFNPVKQPLSTLVKEALNCPDEEC